MERRSGYLQLQLVDSVLWLSKQACMHSLHRFCCIYSCFFSLWLFIPWNPRYSQLIDVAEVMGRGEMDVILGDVVWVAYHWRAGWDRSVLHWVTMTRQCWWKGVTYHWGYLLGQFSVSICMLVFRDCMLVRESSILVCDSFFWSIVL